MFGSQILEVGIGLILVFLLVSLFLTTVRESVENVFKTRGRDLEHALAELLDDHDGTGARRVLYSHPLVSALFAGRAKPTAFKHGKVLKRGSRNFPSYIPRETFSTVVEDMLSKGTASEKVATAYQAILQSAGGDPVRARRGLEQWYDAAMDRAAGWYKRRTHRVLFYFGMGIAVALNINAITIAQYLSTDAAALQQVVGAAEGLANDPAAAEALAPRPRPVPAPRPQSGPASEGAADPGNEAAAVQNAAVPTPTPEAAPVEPTDGLAERQAAIRDAIHQQLRSAGLPIGWSPDEARRTWDGLTKHGFWEGLLFALTLLGGWLMVAFAGTVGAPFWFDLLGKVMVVRSTVKPTEKSRDEASKDGGTGGAPVIPPPPPPVPSVG
jgi:hypothetical protein